VGQNDVTWGHANSTDMAQDQQVSKAEGLAYLSMNTGENKVLKHERALFDRRVE
jgi:hypothetical protein